MGMKTTRYCLRCDRPLSGDEFDYHPDCAPVSQGWHEGYAAGFEAAKEAAVRAVYDTTPLSRAACAVKIRALKPVKP